jgi:hypothetical protein
MNATKAIFSNMQKSFEEATADQGLGSLGEWPPAGVHNCYVIGVSSHEGEFKQAGDGAMFPAVVTQFTYQLVEDPDHAEPLEFKGAPMTIPQDPSQITNEGSQIRARIEIQRLKGHMKTLLGREPGDIGADMGEIESMLSGETSVVCTVQCKYNQRGDRVFRTEYLQSLLSG